MGNNDGTYFSNAFGLLDADVPLFGETAAVRVAMPSRPVQFPTTMPAPARTRAGSHHSTVTTYLTGKMSSAATAPHLLVLPVVVVG